MIDQSRVVQRRNVLVQTARAKNKVTYYELATALGVASQSIGKYLNQIYEDELSKGRPDLTLVAVYSDTGYGRYNSRGAPAQSIKIDPKNRSHVRDYETELAKVYAYPW